MNNKNTESEFQCSSINDCSGGDYCKQCGHAFYTDFIGINGFIHRFQFNPRFGVELLNNDGMVSKRVLKETHPFWEKFEQWLSDNNFR